MFLEKVSPSKVKHTIAEDCSLGVPWNGRGISGSPQLVIGSLPALKYMNQPGRLVGNDTNVSIFLYNLNRKRSDIHRTGLHVFSFGRTPLSVNFLEHATSRQNKIEQWNKKASIILQELM